MRPTIVVAVLVAFLLVLSHSFRALAGEAVPALEVVNYKAQGHKLAQSIAAIAAPLKSLTDEQRASVAALLVVTRVVATGQVSPRSPGATVLDEVWKETEAVCPPIRSVSFSRGGCIDAEVAYASAMARCQAKGKPEDECEKLASPELAAAVNCRMKEIEALRRTLGGIPGRTWPPGPFPWPVEGDPSRHTRAP